MTPERRPYRRESEETRREALIGAALDIVATEGPAQATVRAIADRAGVTPGLIRHYFTSKEELVRTAYLTMMDRMTTDSRRGLDAADAPVDPAARLALFVANSLRAPVVDPQRLGLWAAFIQRIRHESEMRDIHRHTYHRYRSILEDLIRALALPGFDDRRCREAAITCNAVIDGLWMESSALPEEFVDETGAVRIGVSAVGALLGLDLAAALPPEIPGDTE